MLYIFLVSITASSDVTYLWPAVVEVYNLTESLGGSVPDDHIAILANRSLDLWRSFRYTGEDRNDMFFHWQQGQQVRRNSAWLSLTNSTAFSETVQFVRSAATKYMQRMSINASLDMISWAAVHEAGDYHGVHTHTGDAVVCVLYLRVGEGSGELAFFDPRGYLPPFGRSRVHKVHAGQLWLFPAWLPHSAFPSVEKFPGEYRITYAFNFGQSDASADFDLFEGLSYLFKNKTQQVWLLN